MLKRGHFLQKVKDFFFPGTIAKFHPKGKIRTKCFARRLGTKHREREWTENPPVHPPCTQLCLQPGTGTGRSGQWAPAGTRPPFPHTPPHPAVGLGLGMGVVRWWCPTLPPRQLPGAGGTISALSASRSPCPAGTALAGPPRLLGRRRRSVWPRRGGRREAGGGGVRAVGRGWGGDEAATRR